MISKKLVGIIQQTKKKQEEEAYIRGPWATVKRRNVFTNQSTEYVTAPDGDAALKQKSRITEPTMDNVRKSPAKLGVLLQLNLLLRMFVAKYTILLQGFDALLWGQTMRRHDTNPPQPQTLEVRLEWASLLCLPLELYFGFL